MKRAEIIDLRNEDVVLSCVYDFSETVKRTTNTITGHSWDTETIVMSFEDAFREISERAGDSEHFIVNIVK